MTIQELRREPHLSASAVREYLDCGLHYRFSHIDRIQPAFTADALVFGKTIHAVLERYYRSKLSGHTIKLRELVEYFEWCWTEQAKDNPSIAYRKGNDFHSLLEQGASLISTFLENAPDEGYSILSTEQPFRLGHPDLPVPVIGVIDLIEEDASGTIVITEFKTANRAYNNADIDRNLQLTLYGLAARMNGFNDREVLLRIDCLLKTRTPRFERYYTARTNEDEQRAVRLLTDVWRGIQASVFIPNINSWRCGNCEYAAHCHRYLISHERRTLCSVQ